jgi:hypothetical protein
MEVLEEAMTTKEQPTSANKPGSFRERMAEGRRVASAGAAVLSQDRELYVFPVAASLFGLLALYWIGFDMIAAQIKMVLSLFDLKWVIIAAILAFVYFIIQRFIITVCSMSLLVAVEMRLDGRDPRVIDGIRGMLKRFRSILGYSLVSGFLGLFLRGTVALILFKPVTDKLAGMSWGAANFLVVPVMLAENCGPVEAIKRATIYMRQTFGEHPEQNFQTRPLFLAFYLPILIAGLALAALFAWVRREFVSQLALFVSVFLLVCVWTAGSTISSLWSVAVYRYIRGAKTPESFQPELLAHAFKPGEKDEQETA